jgi:hypothetical protein
MTGSDFYHITEMITRNIELQMSEDTYDCILNSVFGMKPSLRNPILNGHLIVFDSTLPFGQVTVNAKYKPYTKPSTTIQLTC